MNHKLIPGWGNESNPDPKTQKEVPVVGKEIIALNQVILRQNSPRERHVW